MLFQHPIPRVLFLKSNDTGEGVNSMAERSQVGARKAMEFLRTSELVNLDIPVSRLTDSVSKLEEVAGYVLAWEKYVLVVADIADVATNPVNRA
jgi:hypothetical protein